MSIDLDVVLSDHDMYNWKHMRDRVVDVVIIMDFNVWWMFTVYVYSLVYIINIIHAAIATRMMIRIIRPWEK